MNKPKDGLLFCESGTRPVYSLSMTFDDRLAIGRLVQYRGEWGRTSGRRKLMAHLASRLSSPFFIDFRMVEETLSQDVHARIYAFGLFDIRHGSGDAVHRATKFSSLQSVSEKIVGGAEGLSPRIHVDGPPELFVEATV